MKVAVEEAAVVKAVESPDLRRSRWDLDVRYVGPRESVRLSSGVLLRTVVYAQPGGGELERAYRKLRGDAPAIPGPAWR